VAAVANLPSNGLVAGFGDREANLLRLPAYDKSDAKVSLGIGCDLVLLRELQRNLSVFERREPLDSSGICLNEDPRDRPVRRCFVDRAPNPTAIVARGKQQPGAKKCQREQNRPKRSRMVHVSYYDTE
jgi:hypothetical protein